MTLAAKHFLLALTTVTLLASCKDKSSQQVQANILDETQGTQVLSTSRLPSQKFTINADRDTVLKGKSGTVLRIYKNTFVTPDGKPITGNIEIELKEAFQPTDILLSGLTTTTNGRFLETGGMLYVNATSDGQSLEMANNKYIGVIAPDSKLKKGMKIYEGEVVNGVVNWKSPKATLNENLKTPSPVQDAFQNPAPAKDSGREVVKSEAGMSDIDLIVAYIESDTSKPKPPAVNQKKKKVAKQAKLQKVEEDRFLNEIQNNKGTNSFLEDYNTNYIFSLKKLGWANIDRLFEDPRTKEVELITNIENQKEFANVYTTLIITKKAMYIPGYQRKDGTFSFTHDDDEAAQLPVGESVTILATAYKDGKPYYAIKTITISEKQQVNMKLEASTEEKLKEILDKEI